MAPTRENLATLQAGHGDLFGLDKATAENAAITFSEENLAYNRDWSDINRMNDEVFSPSFRSRYRDSSGTPWKISWFCMDHGELPSNPRNKEPGFGRIHSYYRSRIEEAGVDDEIQFHFHPRSVGGHPLAAATSYNNNSPEFVQAIAIRLIEFSWFPSSFRPGFHSIRPDSNLFLEQWFPFDYSNQHYEYPSGQPDLDGGRFGDWRRAPKTWRGYHPSPFDYQAPGNLRRTVFRCLNLGTRHRLLTVDHVRQAFSEAQELGSAVLAFTNHDWRQIQPDIAHAFRLLSSVAAEFEDVDVRFSGAEEAAIATVGDPLERPVFEVELSGSRLNVSLVRGSLQGAQPFLAVETLVGDVFHDNFDEREGLGGWTYTFDEQTCNRGQLRRVGVGGASHGGATAVVLEVI